MSTPLDGVKFKIYSKACGKWRYMSKEHALEDIENHRATFKRKKNKKRGLPRYAYVCPICGSWHLTQQEQHTGKGKG